MLDSLKELWGIIMSLIIFGAWLVRMEARVNTNAKEVLRLERQIEREREDTREALSDLKDMLAEQNRDIKILLGRGHQVHWNDKTHPPR
ncbi:hypothetical protein [Paracoccus wurundjeri]|uniref:hypothetical protein n=1 Tax=Paracoccus onubensis TaxID=1675788 RepID=UPI00272F8494|nr:hypothetical protein [Paracoccus onubensis]